MNDQIREMIARNRAQAEGHPADDMTIEELKQWMPMSPIEFQKRMHDEAADSDIECSHGAMDDLMCELLDSLGYGVGIRIFADAPRSYA